MGNLNKKNCLDQNLILILFRGLTQKYSRQLTLFEVAERSQSFKRKTFPATLPFFLSLSERGSCLQVEGKKLEERIKHIYIYKGKSVPLQAWSGPEGSRKLRFPDFMTTAQDVGKVVSLTHRPSLPPGNTPGTHFC
jgi:hypothetical protein